MQLIKRALVYGFLLWLTPFIISVIIFPLKKSDPIFFQSILALIAVLTLIFFTTLYFKKVSGNLREGVFLGVIFLAISLFFDFLFFIWGPVKMSVLSYIKEIGIGYLVYPALTIGVGYLLGRNKSA